jgi:CheY-like chemotaxis protein
MNEEKETGRYILSIEDNPDDFEIISRSLRKVAPNRIIRQCQSGDEALKFLRSRHEPDAIEPNIGLPRIILLDLNLPGTDGRDILKVIKNDKNLKSIPVIIFSTSSNEKDIETCYSNGANAYLKKPSTLDGFVEIARALDKFWFECAFLAIA